MHLLLATSLLFAALVHGDKLSLHAHMRGSAGRSPQGASPLPTLLLSRTPTNASTNASDAWAWFSLADAPWTTKQHQSYALWGAGNYAAYAWGSAPTYIASYSCQSPFILEKLLALGGVAERALAATWLLTMPLSPVGKVWEAQNSEWHVAVQGTWESSAEAVLMARLLAAHGEAELLGSAPERLVCTSRDGGVSWQLGGSGVPQPGLGDGTCAAAPRELAGTPPGLTPPPPAPLLFVDTPSLPFGGPSSGLQNSGRLLTQALRVSAPVTHVALPLVSKARPPQLPWLVKLAVYDTATLRLVAEVSLNASAGTWSSVPLPLQPGLYLLSLSLSEALPPGVLKPSDSWFLGVSWVSNGRPGAGGGAGQGTFGNSTHWQRQRGSSRGGQALARSTTPTPQAAALLEAARVARAQAEGAPALGRSIADAVSVALAYSLALASQVPTPGVGGYDVLVIPDPLFRGSLKEGVDSGCSYYDLLRIGFASSYINLRFLEALEAYSELQAAGLVASTCPPGASALGNDNAALLDSVAGDATPCYSAEDIAAITAAVRGAVGSRFSTARGEFADWLGCEGMGRGGGNVSACGLQEVRQGVLPAGSPLTRVYSGFLPTAALAVRLGVPAGGGNFSATVEEFERLRVAGGQDELAMACRGSSAASARAGNTTAYYGKGWWHTNVCPLESQPSGAHSSIAGESHWALRDAAGYAVRSVNNTGDWHMFEPASIAAGGPRGYGQWSAQAENGGRFFTTAAMVWEAVSSPYRPGQPAANPYASMAVEWDRLVAGLSGIGQTLQGVIDPALPLLPEDPGMLAAPVEDGVVLELCAAVRAQFHFPNVTDAWGRRLCNYYQDIGWATPENGVALYSFFKGLLGMHVRADGRLMLVGGLSGVWSEGAAVWKVSAQLPGGWPQEVAGVELRGLAVRGVGLQVQCAVGGQLLQCSVGAV